MFVSTKVKKIKNLYTVKITYSYYGIYYFDELSVHETLELANQHIINARCGNHIAYDVQ